MTRSNNTQRKGSELIPARVALAKVTRPEVPKFVTLAEVQRACELLDGKPRVRAFVRMLWLTGARRSEALAVRVADLDFRLKLVTLPTLKRRKPTSRTVPLPESFLGELAVLVNTLELKREDRVFAWSKPRAFEVVRDAFLAAGVDRARCKPHALRHGHAIHALQNGAPLNIVQRALGHATIATTSIYLTATAADVRRFYSSIEW